MKREDLTNKEFGDWTALEYAGNRKWRCRCSCGEIKEVSTASLKDGRSTNCGSKSKHIVYGSKQFVDLTGRHIGKLTVKKYLGDSQYLCECECGNTKIAYAKYLKSEVTTSCGCSNKPTSVIHEDLTGRYFGEWEVIEYLGSSTWKCKCSCGKESEIQGYQLTSGRSKSCGHPNNKGKYSLGNKFGDIEIIGHDTGSDVYKVRCICGFEKDVSDSAVWGYATYGYICNHKVRIGQRFGSLVIDSREKGGICNCTCDCGNKTSVFIGNLTNGSTRSCGCIRSASTYTKEEFCDIINQFEDTHGRDPMPMELLEITGLGETTVYETLHKYGLEKYLNRYSSLAEQEIADLCGECIRNDRKVLHGRELDIYIPNKNIAIEYNGNFWHDVLHKGKTYHQDKFMDCAKNNIRLINIFEYEWRNEDTKRKLKTFINTALNGPETILHARNLSICEIGYKEAKKFNEENHLQGGDAGSINIALKSDEGIQSLMCLGTPRFDHNYDYEIIRYCNRTGVGIAGGAEKIFKYFTKTYTPDNVLTYVDLSKFTGSVYTRLGFKTCKEPVTQPNYVWVSSDCKLVYNRYETQKSKLVKLEWGTENETEDTIMTRLNFYKTYNCGNLKLEWNP